MKWRIESLGINVHLLIAPQDIAIKQIHQSSFLIKKIFGNDLNDIVPAYHSIAIFIELPISDLVKRLNESTVINTESLDALHQVEIPICYELGLDLQHIAKASSLSVDEIISIHLAGEYQSLFIGFTPGFVYAGGLDKRLECARKATPRKRVEAGSIGIGGVQTGIYALASPAGWNILGRTPMKIFDQNRDSPMLIEVGTSFKFRRITKQDFEAWEN